MCWISNCDEPPTVYYLSGDISKPDGIWGFCDEHLGDRRKNYPDYCFDSHQEAELAPLINKLIGDIR